MGAFKSDFFSATGSSHETRGEFGQDYAGVVGLDGAVALAVFDGCGGAERSDLASRLWLLALEKALADKAFDPKVDPAEAIFAALAGAAGQAFSALGLDGAGMLSTVVLAFVDESSVRFVGFGDGAFGIVGPSGFDWARLDWSSNAPPYPSYWLDPGRPAQAEAWIKMGQSPAWSGPGELARKARESSERAFCISSFENGAAPFWDVSTDLVVGDGAWVSTDGLFSCRGGASEDEDEVRSSIEPFFAFKSTEGSFLRRRGLKELASRRKAGDLPFDDLTVACALPEGED